MKVWVVVEHVRYDGDNIRGVFSTLLQAMRFRDDLSSKLDHEEARHVYYDISEWDVDGGDDEGCS